MGKKVLTAGTFDIIHAGHVRLLIEAKKLAGPDGELVVIIARDENVKKYKGHPPIFTESERLFMMQNLKPVDRAVLGDSRDPISAIEREKPDIIVLGYDQWPTEEWLSKELEKRGLKTKIVRMRKFEVEVPSTSTVVERIMKLFSNQGGRRTKEGRSKE
ncbi:MAG: FAD synthase [Thermoproteota archaeon]|nr:MAG: FAD synthase [Candidatus Korarchaeota archaeon]RLG54598.1 MAG: FAD synthase [Candidatus Korarchaeota archaeon]